MATSTKAIGIFFNQPVSNLTPEAVRAILADSARLDMLTAARYHNPATRQREHGRHVFRGNPVVSGTLLGMSYSFDPAASFVVPDQFEYRGEDEVRRRILLGKYNSVRWSLPITAATARDPTLHPPYWQWQSGNVLYYPADGINFLTPSPAGGTPPYTQICGPLPSGVNFNVETSGPHVGRGRLTGTAPAVGTYPLTLVVRDAAKRLAEQKFDLVVLARAAPVIVAPSFPSPGASVQNWTFGTAITALTVPAPTGTAPITLTAHDLPSGVSFDAPTRRITGDANSLGGGVIRIRAANPRGQTATYLVPYLTALPTAPSFGALSETTRAWNVDKDIGIIQIPAPTGSGTVAIRVRYDSDIPRGVVYNYDRNQLLGTPLQESSGSIYIEALDRFGQRATYTVNYAVTDPLPRFRRGVVIRARGWAENVPIVPTVLPEAVGGKTPYTYTLTGVPAGIVLDSATRTMSGTPPADAETGQGSYTVTDADGNTASLSFVWGVTPPNSWTQFPLHDFGQRRNMRAWYAPELVTPPNPAVPVNVEHRMQVRVGDSPADVQTRPWVEITGGRAVEVGTGQWVQARFLMDGEFIGAGVIGLVLYLE